MLKINRHSKGEQPLNTPPVTLSHYSAQPLLRVKPAPNVSEIGAKPKGLWLSVDGPYDWPSWVGDEMEGRANDCRFRTVVKLTPDAPVLTLSTVLEVAAFTERYRASLQTYLRNFYMDWERVAKEYGGIILSPYLPECRYGDADWYNPWDCASACLWSPDVVESLGPSESFTIEYRGDWNGKD